MIAADIAFLLSVLGLAQACAGWIAVAWLADSVARARRGRSRAASASPAITILKPLHGDEPLLEQALATTCQQDYPTFQIVFGVSAASDTALPTVERVRARFPMADIAIVVDPAVHGENRKVGNLINMLPAAKHGVLVIADSDVHVMSDWLRRLVDALDEPQVGLVTAAYTGIPACRSIPDPARRGQVGASLPPRRFPTTATGPPPSSALWDHCRSTSISYRARSSLGRWGARIAWAPP